MVRITIDEAREKDCPYQSESKKCTVEQCMAWCYSDGWNIVEYDDKGFCSKLAADLRIANQV